jgi:hypothetical protein
MKYILSVPYDYFVGISDKAYKEIYRGVMRGKNKSLPSTQNNGRSYKKEHVRPKGHAPQTESGERAEVNHPLRRSPDIIYEPPY